LSHTPLNLFVNVEQRRLCITEFFVQLTSRVLDLSRGRRMARGQWCGSGRDCRINLASWAISCRGMPERCSSWPSSHWRYSASPSSPRKSTARSSSCGCRVSDFSCFTAPLSFFSYLFIPLLLPFNDDYDVICTKSVVLEDYVLQSCCEGNNRKWKEKHTEII